MLLRSSSYLRHGVCDRPRHQGRVSVLPLVYSRLGGAMPRRKYKGTEMVLRPLIEIHRTEYEKTTLRLDREVISRLADYCSFVSEVTGEAPTPDEVIDHAMKRLFDSDRGFKLWLSRQGPAETAGE